MRFEIGPTRTLVDEPVIIRIVGAPIHQLVTIDARMRDQSGRQWTSNATFLVNADGSVDLDRQSPVSGTYTGVDPIGLFWSMKIEAEIVPDDSPAPMSVAPVAVHFDARIDGATTRLQLLNAVMYRTT
jgi:hypothetical protein